jgi:hypothetical protein
MPHALAWRTTVLFAVLGRPPLRDEDPYGWILEVNNVDRISYILTTTFFIYVDISIGEKRNRWDYDRPGIRDARRRQEIRAKFLL